jgi:hypothetical protein
MQVVKKILSGLVITTTTMIIAIPGNAATPEQTLSLLEMLSGKTYNNILAPQDYKFESPSGGVNLIKGMPIANGTSLGATAAFKDFSPKSALQAAGIDMNLNAIQAGELKFLKEIPIKDLLIGDPTMASLTGEAIGWTEQGSKTLADIAKTDLGKLPLPEVVLTSNSIGQLGNLANVPYGRFPGAEKLSINKFVGLPDIPITKLIPASLPTTGSGIHLVRIDKIRTKEKGVGVNPKIVTGSDQRPKAQWTSDAPVDVVELRDAVISDKSNLVNGSLMVVGSSQMIPGGNVPCPLQPTALAIPGTDLALSVESLNAREGSARLQLNMRLTYPFGLRTSYFIPIPLPLTVTEKSRTTLLPLEIPEVLRTKPPASLTLATLIPGTVPKTTPGTIPTMGIGEILPTEASPIAINIAKGNIGLAVKTNAINPAVGGVL